MLAIGMAVAAPVCQAQNTTSRNTTAQQANNQRNRQTNNQRNQQANSQRVQQDSINAIMDKAVKGDAVAQNEVGGWFYKGINGKKRSYEEALQWFARSAKQGNAQATCNMAICYQTGHGSKKDSTMAVQLYDKAIERGNKEVVALHEKESGKGSLFSSLYLAHCYKDGVGVQKNTQKLAQYYAQASKQGSADASREAGLAYLNGRNSTEAVKFFKVGADRGDLSSTYWYGKLLLDGNGTTQNKDQGFLYIKKAADRKFPMALYQVGNCYRDGSGVKASQEKAAEYYLSAAQADNVHGCWEYALCQMEGKGTARNYESALYWFGKAANKGYSRNFKNHCTASENNNWTTTPFMNYLKAVKAYNEGNMETVMEEAKALKKAKMQEGELLEAMCLTDARYKKANAKKGAKILLSLADKNAAAAYLLAQCYEKGSGVTKDSKQALAYYEKAAKMNYAPAQCILGDMYYEGNGVKRDYPTAMRFYTVAYEQRRMTASAATRMAACYENATGTARNVEMAAKVKALDTNDHQAELFKLY